MGTYSNCIFVCSTYIPTYTFNSNAYLPECGQLYNSLMDKPTSNKNIYKPTNSLSNKTIYNMLTAVKDILWASKAG